VVGRDRGERWEREELKCGRQERRDKRLENDWWESSDERWKTRKRQDRQKQNEL